MLATPMARLPPTNASLLSLPKKYMDIADFPYVISPMIIVGITMLQSLLFPPSPKKENYDEKFNY